jgi:hypothetical protein
VDRVESASAKSVIPNKDIFLILLEISMELGLSETEQCELLSYLNAVNESL